MVLNSDLKIVQVNEAFLEHANLKREDIIGFNFDNSPFFISNDPNMILNVKKGLNGESTSFEMNINSKNREMHFKLKVIPSVFVDGEKGVTIITEDITEKTISNKILQENLALLR